MSDGPKKHCTNQFSAGKTNITISTVKRRFLGKERCIGVRKQLTKKKDLTELDNTLTGHMQTGSRSSRFSVLKVFVHRTIIEKIKIFVVHSLY